MRLRAIARRLFWTAIVMSLMSAGGARAVPPRISLVETTVYDNNFSRVPEFLRSQAPHDGADIGNVFAIMGNYETAMNSIALVADGAVQKTFFVYDSGLNAFEYDFSGRASYKDKVGNAELSLDQERVATSYEDLRIGRRSTQNITIAHLTARRALVGGVGALIDVTGTQNKNSDYTASLGDNRQVNAIAGIGYISPSGNILAVEAGYLESSGLHERMILISRRTRDYRANFVDRSIGLHLEWNPSVIWSVSGRVGYTHHDDRSGIAEDFRGLTGNGSIMWSPTDFLKATITAQRSFSSNMEPFANGIKTTSYGARIDAKPWDRTNFSFSASRRRRIYRYDLQVADPLSAGRTERLTTISGSISRSLAFGPTVTLAGDMRWRRSNYSLFNYKGRSVTLGLSWPIIH